MKFEYMTEKEIVDSYIRNGKTGAQINILAQLNDCTPEAIKEVLKNNNILERRKRVLKGSKIVLIDERMEYVVPISVWATLLEQEERLKQEIKTHQKGIEQAEKELKEHQDFRKVLESLIK